MVTRRICNSNLQHRRSLPEVTGYPHKLHLKDNAIPYAAHYWKDEIKQPLNVKLGILQNVPVGEPTEWCMRMIPVATRDGNPRRTVDFQPLNKYYNNRETHHTLRPFDVVSNIPLHTYKTVLDTYNGYHQVPLDKESVKLTTFITEFGRYQYLRVPEGHTSSGDAYKRLYDYIIAQNN